VFIRVFEESILFCHILRKQDSLVLLQLKTEVNTSTKICLKVIPAHLTLTDIHHVGCVAPSVT